MRQWLRRNWAVLLSFILLAALIFVGTNDVAPCLSSPPDEETQSPDQADGVILALIASGAICFGTSYVLRKQEDRISNLELGMQMLGAADAGLLHKLRADISLNEVDERRNLPLTLVLEARGIVQDISEEREMKRVLRNPFGSLPEYGQIAKEAIERRHGSLYYGLSVLDRAIQSRLTFGVRKRYRKAVYFFRLNLLTAYRGMGRRESLTSLIVRGKDEHFSKLIETLAHDIHDPSTNAETDAPLADDREFNLTFVQMVRSQERNERLEHAVEQGDYEKARTALEAGADPDYVSGDMRWTPLHASIMPLGSPRLVGLLLKHGADPNGQDDDGMTPLHWACGLAGEPEMVEIVELLLTHGASVDRTDSDGRTPVEHAKEGGFHAVLKLIHEYGGSPQ